MDAGLAAVLGAAVGAIGTGGAATITALLGRSQARLQARVEHQRTLRDARRSAYANLTESIINLRNRLMDCYAILGRGNRPGRRELREVYSRLDQCDALSEAMSGPLAIVMMEGPMGVANSAVAAVGEMYRYHTALANLWTAFVERAPYGVLLEEARAAHGESWNKENAFNLLASQALENFTLGQGQSMA